MALKGDCKSKVEVFRVVETAPVPPLYRSLEKKKGLNLRQLTRGFLGILLKQSESELYSLQQMASQLGVLPRKLYDIINVL